MVSDAKDFIVNKLDEITGLNVYYGIQQRDDNFELPTPYANVFSPTAETEIFSNAENAIMWTFKVLVVTLNSDKGDLNELTLKEQIIKKLTGTQNIGGNSYNLFPVVSGDVEQSIGGAHHAGFEVSITIKDVYVRT